MSVVHPTFFNIPRNFEDILQRTGWGIYYKFLVGYSCANFFMSALAFISLYLALPLSTCDEIIAKESVIFVHISFILGEAIGGFILCSISDNTGRRCMIPQTHLIIFASCFVIAFSHNSYTFYISAFCLGSGLQTNTVSVKSYLSEILPMQKRGFYLILPDLFWTLGYFLTAVATYFLTTSAIIEHQGVDMRLTTWRIAFAISGGLSLVLACTSALLEMSPRFLLLKRRYITASLVLKQFYAINKSKYSETFDLQGFHLYNLISDYGLNVDYEPQTNYQFTVFTLKLMKEMSKLLWRKRFIVILIPMIILNVLVFLGLVQMSIFFSKVLQSPANKTVIGVDFLHMSILDDASKCSFAIDNVSYGNFFLVSINILFGQGLLLCVIDHVGRKIPILVGLAICGISCFFLAFADNFLAAAVLASTFIAGYSMAKSAIFVTVLESFPTVIRGTACGQIFLYSSVLSCFIYYFIQLSSQHFFIAMGIMMIGASVNAFFIPDLKKKPLTE